MTGFGTGAENNLTLTVQPGGSITAPNDINLGSGNTVINNGALVVVGGPNFGGDGVTLGNSSKLTNTGTITTAADGGSGVSMSPGGTLINNGLIGASGQFGTGVWFNGANSTVVNNGTIQSIGYSLGSVGGNGNSVTNNGTLDGLISVMGTGNSLINAGLITITNSATALAAGDFSR